MRRWTKTFIFTVSRTKLRGHYSLLTSCELVGENEPQSNLIFFYSLKDEFSLTFFLTVIVAKRTPERGGFMTKSLHARLGGAAPNPAQAAFSSSNSSSVNIPTLRVRRLIACKYSITRTCRS